MTWTSSNEVESYTAIILPQTWMKEVALAFSKTWHSFTTFYHCMHASYRCCFKENMQDIEGHSNGPGGSEHIMHNVTNKDNL